MPDVEMTCGLDSEEPQEDSVLLASSFGGCEESPQADQELMQDDDNVKGEREAGDDQKDMRWKAPSILDAAEAHKKIKEIMFPHCSSGYGYKDHGLDWLLLKWLCGMQQFLWKYSDEASHSYGQWMAASLAIAKDLQHGAWFAQWIHQWSCAFIEDEGDLPYSIYGTWNESMMADEDLQQEVMTHLQMLCKYISAYDLQQYIN